MDSLLARQAAIRADYQSKKPFRYVMFESFLKPEQAALLHDSYPGIELGKWDGVTYVDQKNKFAKTSFEPNSLFDRVFRELNSPEFLVWLEAVTGIEELEGDPQLFGGGLHQSIHGAFLNVHVDYNFHPETKHHRRCNVLVYMNQEWQDEYEGNLELWDLEGGKMEPLGKFAPLFNRCVIFETNEISFHGHPRKLNTPQGMTRKSMATYYYTKTRPAHELAGDHNTVYVNTEGATGQVKRFQSGVKAFLERINIGGEKK